MGTPIEDGLVIKNPATVPEAIEFIKQTEGNNPVVADPRKYSEVKSELTAEELAKQAEATEKAAKEFLKNG